MNWVYMIYKNGELFAYSYDREMCYLFLKILYLRYPKIELNVIRMLESTKLLAVLDEHPEIEIIEFHSSIPVLALEYGHWLKYFQNLYYQVKDYMGENDISSKYMESLDTFLIYLGKDKITQAIKNESIESIQFQLDMDREFEEMIMLDK